MCNVICYAIRVDLCQHRVLALDEGSHPVHCITTTDLCGNLLNTEMSMVLSTIVQCMQSDYMDSFSSALACPSRVSLTETGIRDTILLTAFSHQYPCRTLH